MVLNKIAIEKEVIASESVAARDDYSTANLESAYEVDVLSQFKANLQQVEELNARLRYVLSEVSGLIKRR